MDNQTNQFGNGLILKKLLADDVIVVFDIDGTLATYEFGAECHVACDDSVWDTFVKENQPYSKMKAVPQIAQFIHDKGTDNVYVCSVAADYERDDKGGFVHSQYGIPNDHVIFVDSKKDKTDVLRKLGQGGKRVAIVDDTVATLEMVYKETGYMTVHVSSFFFYIGLAES